MPPRIVSLVPSSTETLLALGADVVACTRFCEQPGLLHVGGTKNPDIAAIVDLEPDLVVMDREENRREDADALTSAGLALFISAVTTVADAEQVIVDLADQSNRPRPAGVAAPLGHDTKRESRATAFVPIWRRPWMSINRGTYGADLLAHLGIALVTAHLEDPYPTLELDDVTAMHPDMVLVPSEPYDFDDGHIDELRTVVGGDVPVVRIDGRDLFWWGIRTPGAIVRLREQLTPLRG